MSVPWFIGGGAEHPPEVARLLAFAGTGGKEGIVTPESMKVVPLATPGAGVRVSTGGVILLNRSAGGQHQSYTDRLASMTTVPVPANNTGSAVSHLVVRRVMDPQYPPWPTPADVVNGPYSECFLVQGVPPDTESAVSLNLGYPAVALARIDVPAYTSAITAGMIKDLRVIANPRRERYIRVTFPAGSPGVAVPTSAYSGWPPTSAHQFLVPDWATYVDVVFHLSGVRFAAGSTSTAMGLRTWFGDGSGTSGGSTQNGIAVEDESGRYHYSIGGTHYIPPERRNIRQWLMMQAVRTEGDGQWYADYQTTVIGDFEFVERPD